MYTHCLFCTYELGRNEVIETFPVGRRLAFDAAKGRLWVVCERCSQWNLTPLEIRWEAVEQCEREFRGTTRRVQGENVGLARLPEGLTLVRIGKPKRPEFAAWRYGDQFGRRRRRAIGGAVAGTAGVGALAVGLPMLGVGALMFPALTIIGNLGITAAIAKHDIRLPHPEGGQMVLTVNERSFVRLVQRSPEEGGWGLDVPYKYIAREGDPWWRGALNTAPEGTARLSGLDAQRAAATLMTSINASGAPASRVQKAVQLIEDAGGPDHWFVEAAKRTRQWGAEQLWGDTGALRHLPGPVKLSLEMAAHEDAERRALEGELEELEERWRDAEEVAAIADDLLLPAGVRALFDRFRRSIRG